MKKVRIAGVPEHFNFPWHMAIEEGAFEYRGIDLEWMEVPEGTGKMCQMLQEKQTDLAIILTEGIIKSITGGNSAKIVQEFIASPLLWGIHVDANASYYKLSDIEHKTVAISRFGSGSHLMAYVNAQHNDWNPQNLNFEVVHTLEGAINSLAKGESDYFMWEHFTTKPLVDNQTFRRLGDCPTPWPCFVIAATDDFIARASGTLVHLLEVINSYTAEFKKIPSIDRTLANRYDQKLHDIKHWLSITQWSQAQLSDQTIKNVQHTLLNLNLIDTIIQAKNIRL